MQARPHLPRRRQFQLALLVFWSAILIPMAVAVYRRVRYFHPVVSLSELPRLLEGRRLEPLLDLRDAEPRALEDQGALLRALGGGWSGSSRGLELDLQASHAAWGSLELDVPAFLLSERDLVIGLRPSPADMWLELTLAEADGDRWQLSGRAVPAGQAELRISIVDLDYVPLATTPEGLQPIVRLYLCLGPSVPSQGGSVVLERLQTAPAQAEPAKIIPVPPSAERPFRNRYPEVKPAGTYRIALLGDSMVYGSGLKGAEDEVAMTFGAKLEAALREERPQLQVLNFGVVGYNTEQEVILYEQTARAYQPDLLLLFFFSNDEEDVIAVERASAELRETEKYRQLYAALQDGDRVQRLITQEAHRLVDTDRSMALVSRSLDRLAQATTQDGVPVALVVFYDTPDRQLTVLRAASEAKGWPMLELQPLVGRYGPRRIYVEAERAPYDSHPSEFGHTVIAEALHAFLEEQGLVPPPPP
jgi:hypothetical protein